MTRTADSKHAIAIVGLGSRFPKAKDTDALWDKVINGETSFQEVPPTRWNHDLFLGRSQRDSDKTWTPRGSFIEDPYSFAALHYGIAPRRIEVMDPQHRLLIEATRWALQDAGYDKRPFPRERTGVFVGLNVSEHHHKAIARIIAMQALGGDFGQGSDDPAVQELFMKAVEKIPPLRAFSTTGALTSMASASIAQTFDLHGPAFSLDSACASASIAIHNAVVQLRAGLIDAAVAGGIYLNLTPANWVGFTRIGAISKSGACRPFEARSDGFVESDGVGLLFLKRLEDAQADNDRIHAVIRGSGANNDGRGEGPMTPRAEGQMGVLKAAYADAGVSPASVSYFEAHGTATSTGDPCEVESLGRVLKEAGVTEPTLFGSVKANIGHSMAAAGIASIMKAVKLLQHGEIPAQPDFQAPNPSLQLDKYPLKVSTTRAPLPKKGEHPPRVAVSTFGFGGTNSHFVLEAPLMPARPARYAAPLSAPAPTAVEDKPWPESLLLTAPTPELLAGFASELSDFITEGPAREASLADIAYTLNARRRHERYRAIIRAGDAAELQANLTRLCQALPGAKAWPLFISEGGETSQIRPKTAPPAAVYDAGETDAPRRKLAFMFPGQGAQQVGLMKDLVARFPALKASLTRFDEAASALLPRPLSSYVYPWTDASSPKDEEAQAKALTATEVAQPALTALSLSLVELLKQAGLSPDVSLGHSLGEFTALAAGGALGHEDAVRLVGARGAAMAALKLPDPGAMAAVMAPARQVRSLLEGNEGVWLANINHPRQVTVSGTTDGVAAAVEQLEAAGLSVRRLNVSHAFHTPLFAPLAEALKPALEQAGLQAPEGVVASGVAPTPYSGSVDQMKATLLGHATASVDFVGALGQAQEAGADIFVQLGAGSTLSGLARATLGPQADIVELCPREGDRGAALIDALCQLVGLGQPVDFEAAYADEPRRVVSLPETPLLRRQYHLLQEQPQRSPRMDYKLPAEIPAMRLPAATPERAQPDDVGALAKLFEQQNELLLTQAKALLAQNQALLGQGASPALSAESQALLDGLQAAPAPAVKVATPAPVAPAPAPALPAPKAETEDIKARVYAVVAKVSAFPQDSLRDSQKLVDELGFDSLMVADLNGALQKELPELGELPPELFSLQTTLGTLAAQVLAQLSGEAQLEGAAPPAEEEALVEAALNERAKVEAQVYEVVAQVSAFPQDSLRPSQRLVDELGFDSLMVGDLIAALDKALPGLGNLPPELFNMQTTLGALVAQVQDALNPHKTSTLPAATPAGGPLASYQRTLRETPQPKSYPHEIGGEAWLLIDDFSPLTGAIAAELRDRGAQLLQLRLTDTDSQPTLRVGAELFWPASKLAALPEALKAASIQLDGLIHTGPLSYEADAVAELHALLSPLSVPRVAVVTGLGGKMAASEDKSPELSGLAAYLKSLARERPSAVIRALDVDPQRREAAGRWVVRELLSGERSVEAGFDGKRWLPELQPAPLPEGGRPIRGDDVLLITGGAGDIGRVVARKLAAHEPKAILLVGRSAADEGLKALLSELSSYTNAQYIRADITKAGALEAALAGLPAPTRVLHAAGLIEDARAEAKSAEQLRRVLDVKLKGLSHTLEACPEAKEVLLFTSWAGSFGNRGQVDYAAANASLDAIAEAGLPERRVCALSWPPWEGSAMLAGVPEAAKASLQKQGVRFVSPEEGAEWVEAALQSSATGSWLLGHALPAAELAARVEERFDVESHPYLDDHQLRGRPVVPLASITDWIASAAKELLPSEDPLTIQELRLGRGVFGEEQASLQIRGRREAEGVKASFTLRAGEAEGVAYRGELVRAPVGVKQPIPLGGAAEEAQLSLEDFYAEVLFHGPSMQAVLSVEALTSEGVSGTLKTSLRAELWQREDRAAWAIDPLMLDGAFQLAAYWLYQHTKKTGFPTGFARLVIMEGAPAAPVKATVRLGEIGGAEFSGDILLEDAEGRVFAWVEGVRGRFADVKATAESTLPVPAPVEPAAPPSEASAPAEAPLAEGAAEVPEENWKIESFDEVIALEQRMEMAKLMGIEIPYFNVHEGTARDTSVIEGVEMLNFSSYNYLGYSGHPEVVQAVQDAVAKYGSSVSASRVASGERPLHGALERGIAGHLGVDDSIVFTAGHATNVTTVGHMLGREDLVLHDSLIHDSLLQGIYLSGATRRPFPHADLDAAERMLSQLRKNFRRVMIIAEGIYSMDGDICDLPRLIELKKRHRALLMIDEAHSAGILGVSGRGVANHFGVDAREIDIWMGTLSKSYSSCGGYIAGSAALVRYLKYTAPGFVYSAGITPANAAAALKSLELMEREPEVVERLRSRSRFFLKACQERGLDTGLAVGAAVVPTIVGNSMECMQLSERLKANKINVQPIVYPAVEDEAARLRFFISALHSEAQLTHTADVVARELAEVRKKNEG